MKAQFYEFFKICGIYDNKKTRIGENCLKCIPNKSALIMVYYVKWRCESKKCMHMSKKLSLKFGLLSGVHSQCLKNGLF